MKFSNTNPFNLLSSDIMNLNAHPSNAESIILWMDYYLYLRKYFNSYLDASSGWSRVNNVVLRRSIGFRENLKFRFLVLSCGIFLALELFAFVCFCYCIYVSSLTSAILSSLRKWMVPSAICWVPIISERRLRAAWICIDYRDCLGICHWNLSCTIDWTTFYG